MPYGIFISSPTIKSLNITANSTWSDLVVMTVSGIRRIIEWDINGKIVRFFAIRGDSCWCISSQLFELF